MAEAFKNQGKLVKLLQAQRDLVDKLAAVTNEIDELLAGGPGIGAKMKEIGAAFDAAWCVRYMPGQVKGYVWIGKVDGPNLKRLAQTPGVDEAIARMPRYIANDEPFFVRGKHSFGLFVRSINQWAAAAQSPAVTEEDHEVNHEVAETARRRRALRA